MSPLVQRRLAGQAGEGTLSVRGADEVAAAGIKISGRGPALRAEQSYIRVRQADPLHLLPSASSGRCERGRGKGRGRTAWAPPLLTAPAGAAGRGVWAWPRGVARGGAGLLGPGQPAHTAGATAAAARACKVSPLPQQRPGLSRHVRHGGG